MKTLLFHLLALGLLAQEIAWQKDLATALRSAKTEHKPIMIFYTSKNCSWCRKMERTTFHDPKIVAKVNHTLIPVKVYKEDPHPSSLRSPYTPTTYFRTPQGVDIIRPVLGYVNVEYFDSYLDDVARRKKRYNLP